MMLLISWFAALVVLVTALAMLADLLRADDRQRYRTFMKRGWRNMKRPEIVEAMKFCLRTGVLILIVASAGVAVFLPQESRLQPFEVLLRIGLAGFMVLQTPYPWWRYIAFGVNGEPGKPASGDSP